MLRINWIDVARGIGIILVIQGHALGADSYRHFIYAFHMPLFFFISGLLFDYKKYSLTVTFKKSVKGILIPYVLFALLFYVIWWLQNANFRFEIAAFVSHLSGILYANSNNLFFNLVLWFLPCLFITKTGFALLSKIVKKEKLIIVSLLAFSLLGYFAFVYLPDLTLPFGIESALTAIVFFGGGSILKTNHLKTIDFKVNPAPTTLRSGHFDFSLSEQVADPRFLASLREAGRADERGIGCGVNKNLLTVLGLSLVVLIISSQVNFDIYGRQIDIRLNNLGNYFLFYGGAISGIIATGVISILIKQNRLLQYIGKYSLILFALHPIVFLYITKTLLLFISQSTINELKDFYLSPFYTVITIGIILLTVFIFKKIKPLGLKI